MKSGNKRAAMRVRAIANSCGAYPVKSCQSRFAKLSLTWRGRVRALDKAPILFGRRAASPREPEEWCGRANANPRDDICPPSSLLLLLIFGEQTQVRDYVFFISAVNLKFICLRRKRGGSVYMHHVCYAHGETNNKSGGIRRLLPLVLLQTTRFVFLLLIFGPGRSRSYICACECVLFLFTCLSGGDANPQVEPLNTQYILSQQCMAWGVAGFLFN